MSGTAGGVRALLRTCAAFTYLSRFGNAYKYQVCAGAGDALAYPVVGAVIGVLVALALPVATDRRVATAIIFAVFGAGGLVFSFVTDVVPAFGRGPGVVLAVRSRVVGCILRDVRLGDLEKWVVKLLPSRQFGYIVLTTSAGIMDHEEARRTPDFLSCESLEFLWILPPADQGKTGWG